MNYPTRWTLEGFPERVSGVGIPSPGEVQKAYETWRESREIDPRRQAGRLASDDVRYSADIPNACYADEKGGWQLVCDFDVIEGDWSVPGRVVFVDMDYVEGDDIRG